MSVLCHRTGNRSRMHFQEIPTPHPDRPGFNIVDIYRIVFIMKCSGATIRTQKRQFRFNAVFSFVIPLTGVLIITGCKGESSQARQIRNAETADEYLSWSTRMADSELARHRDSLIYGGSNPDAKWTYTTGLFLKALSDLDAATGKAKYEAYIKKVIDSFVAEDGSIKTYKISDFNLDKINSGRILLTLYAQSGEEKYRKAADLLYEQLQKQPRTAEGGFWHKERYPWQMWLDGIYMSAPFYTGYAQMFNIPEGFDDVVKQITLIDGHTRDPETGLRYHAWDASNKQAWADPVTGCSPHFWGRADGWFSMALVDVLDYLPADHPGRKQIVYILNDLLKSLAKYQDENGLWFQVLDMGREPGNYEETSCSAMFVYSFAKAVRKAYVDSSYIQTARRGYDGLVSHMLTEDPNGLVSLRNICSVAGLGGDPYRDGSYKYYISEPVVANDIKGVAPFIMAGVELAKTAALVKVQ